MEIRILSFNIHKGIGWVTRKSTLAQIHMQLCDLQPDILFLQEVRGAQMEMLTSGIWPHFSYGKNAVYLKGHHGNAILSKFPIHFIENLDLSIRRYERRGLLHSTLKLTEHSQNLHLLCLHLSLLNRDRKIQFERIMHYIQSIPNHEPLILAGDFNDWSSIATEYLVNILGLHEVFLHTQGAYAKTYPAWAPVLRLDRIYIRGFHVNRAHRFTQKPWRYLSDHIAIEAYLKPNFLLKKEWEK